LARLVKSLEQNYVYDGIYSAYRDRIHGRQAGNLSPHNFLGYIQNHDQVGNRAIGDRLRQITGIDRAKIAAALVLTAPFVPMLFQGEEWAASSPFQYFADHDEEMARLVSEGRRREFAAFGWNPAEIPDPEDRCTFERSKLDWSELNAAEHAEMLAWYQRLIQLRRTTPSLNNGEPGQTHVRHIEHDKWLAMDRGEIKVICNLGQATQSFPIRDGSRIILGSREQLSIENGAVMLPLDTVAILA
jgi:maltooligosyltrehalose trehalohydrolase